MPILDPSVSPNAYYALSPFLFWTIVGVACRSYPRNPTLLGFLPAKIHNMALLTLNATVTLQVVQGLLLLLCWPFPKSSSGHDLNYPLAGALVHMATQMGLHLQFRAKSSVGSVSSWMKTKSRDVLKPGATAN